MSDFKYAIEKAFYQKILKPIFFTSRLGRRGIFGHVGDGLFVDYVYRNKPSGYNKMGNIVDRILLNLPVAKATKEKKDRLYSILNAEIGKNILNNKITKIVDLGSGPARYLAELSLGRNREELQSICLDIDNSSLKKGKLISMGSPIEYRLGNITKLRRYKKLSQKIGWRPNIVVVSTCYEFLSDGVVRASIEDVYNNLDTGGMLIIVAQVENPSKKLFEYLSVKQNNSGNRLLYRAPFIIKKWLIEAGFKQINISTDEWNIYSYFIGKKSGVNESDSNTKPIFSKNFDYKRAQEQRSKNIYQYMRGFNPLKNGKALRGEQKVVMMASNNYLGLAMREEIIRAAACAIKKYGASTTSSRILTGNLDIYEELQEKLSEFLNTEDALVFSTGFMANIGVISCLLGKGDVAFVDRNAHASLLDGARLSDGEARYFSHNSTEQLERLLQIKDNTVKGKLIVCDGVYSMDGDLAPLPEICDLADKYHAGLVVDDGHGVGIFGEHGRGAIEHLKVEGRVDIILGSLGKALASVGGFVAGNHTIIDHLRHTARPLLFSTGLAPANVAASLAAINIIQKEPWLRQKLWSNTIKVKKSLRAMGYNTGKSETPLIPIIIGDETTTYKMVIALEESGVIVDGVSFPAVKKNQSRIRIRVIATHTSMDLDLALEAFKAIGKKFGVI